MKDKSITVEDYEKYSGEFFDKYFYVAKQLGEGAKAEDGIRDPLWSRGLGDVYKRQPLDDVNCLVVMNKTP